MQACSEGRGTQRLKLEAGRLICVSAPSSSHQEIIENR